jgi:hypothetical protein
MRPAADWELAGGRREERGGDTKGGNSRKVMLRTRRE